MSIFSRKTFKAIKAIDPKTNRTFSMPVKVDGRIDGISQHRIKKMRRDQKANQHAFKAKLREEKKKIPLAERSKVNWAETGK